MNIKKFSEKINLILITHAFGVQTQYIESVLDGHTETIQFPTNYKDYFFNLKSRNFKDFIKEFISGNPGYVYDIFNSHKNKYCIKDNSRIVPLIKDRDYFYFDKSSLKKIKNDIRIEKYHKFIKQNLNKKYKKKFIFKKYLETKFKPVYYLDLLLETSKSPYWLSKNKFAKIYLKVINSKNFDMSFNKKNLIILLHYCLCLYLKKDPKKIKYIVFNLHDYTNIEELLLDFKKSYHIAVGEDFKIRFSRNKNKIISKNESVIQYCYSNLLNIDKFLETLRIKKKRNYLFFNSYINSNQMKFITTLSKILKIKLEKKLFETTFLNKKSFGNSRNLKTFSKKYIDKQYLDWWNYLTKYEIFFLDFYFQSFFTIFKIRPSKTFQKHNKIIGNLRKFFLPQLFIFQDYIYFFQNEVDTQKQLNQSNLSYLSFKKAFRTPIKIFLYSIFYFFIFNKKISVIKSINKKFKNKKFSLKLYK